jgi:hypothetical protein
MKKISPLFLFGALTVLLLAASCAPVGAGALAQQDLTSSPTATNTTLTPSTPIPGLEVICQYCVDTIAHAQLLLPRHATFEVISPPELASTSGNNDDDDDNGEDDDNGGSRGLTTQLTGEAEVPGQGDPDGSGTATITLRPEQGEVCFDLTVSNIEPATAAHIHEGAEGVAGPVVVPLDPPPTDGSSSGCVSGVDRALIQNILQHPDQYYVNVHNEEFPDGAVRGQLGHVDDDDNGDRLGCRVIDQFRDTKLVLCRAEQNTTITMNVCLDDHTCTEVQITLQSCAPTTGTPSPIATVTQTGTAAATSTPAPSTATATSTSTPVPPATETLTSTVVPDTPTASATSTPTVTSTATTTATSTPTP